MSSGGRLRTRVCEPFSLWHFRQSSRVGISSPAFFDASELVITRASMYSLPGPWHFSQETPSFSEKVSSFSQSSASAPVAWQPRHMADFCGSMGMPLNSAICLASGVARLV